jgi:hypothetical protein
MGRSLLTTASICKIPLSDRIQEGDFRLWYIYRNLKIGGLPAHSRRGSDGKLVAAIALLRGDRTSPLLFASTLRKCKNEIDVRFSIYLPKSPSLIAHSERGFFCVVHFFGIVDSELLLPNFRGAIAYLRGGDRPSPPASICKNPPSDRIQEGVFLCGAFIGIIKLGVLLTILAGLASSNSSNSPPRY